MTLRSHSCFVALALAIAPIAFVPAGLAQTPAPPQADQNHKAHHPEGAAPSAPPGDMSGGMMSQGAQASMMCGGDMKQMMSMMQDMMTMMSAQAGMMSSHVEAKITALKTELKITDTQTPQWNRLAETLRGTAKSMDAIHQQMMQPATAGLPARLARQEEMLSAHLASVKAVKEALGPLYDTLSADQKKVADGLKMGPMGMM